MTAELAHISNEAHANQRTAEYEQIRRAEIHRRCFIPRSLAERFDCRDAINEATAEHERDEYELEANRDSAAWNKAMARAAFLGGGVGVITALLLLYTLLETRRIGEAQTRAYLTVTACEVQFFAGNPNVRIRIRNSGQSPALKVKWRANVTLFVDGAPKNDFRYGETHPNFRDFEHDVPAQGKRWTLFHNCEDGFVLGPVEAAAFAADKAVNMAISAVVEGKNVFGRDVKGTGRFIQIMKIAPDERVTLRLVLASS